MSADKKDRSRNVTKRHEFADYLNIQDTENPSFVLMGTGFTTLDENPGAQTSKRSTSMRRQVPLRLPATRPYSRLNLTLSSSKRRFWPSTM